MRKMRKGNSKKIQNVRRTKLKKIFINEILLINQSRLHYI